MGNQTLDDIQEYIHALRLAREPITAQLKEMDVEIEAAERTLRGLAGWRNEETGQEIVLGYGMTHLEALRAIAKANGGLVNASEAKRIFLASGLSHGKPKNLTPHLYTLLKNSPEFEYASPGTFRLVGDIVVTPPPAKLQLRAL